VKGKLPLLVDGGVRTGGDVLKMLALGADAVLIGRPLMSPAFGALSVGVETTLERIRSELISSMILTGCPDTQWVARRILYGVVSYPN
jgi:4-hydroxymandelate oxidase